MISFMNISTNMRLGVSSHYHIVCDVNSTYLSLEKLSLELYAPTLSVLERLFYTVALESMS